MFLLKNAFSVTEGTFLLVETAELTCFRIESFQGIKYVLQFYSVGADVLYGRGAHRSRDQRKIFNAGITVGNAIAHQIIPNFPRSCFHQHRISACFNPDTLDVHFRSEEHTSALQSLMRISYAVFCLKKKQYNNIQ